MKKEPTPRDIPLNKIARFWDELIKPGSNISTGEEDKWKRKAEFLDDISVQNQVMVFLWNPFTNRFLYMSDKVKLLSAREVSAYLAEDGVAYSYSRFYPEHIEANMKFSQLGATYFTKNNSFSNKEIVVSFNYKYKNGNNEFVQVLQRVQALELDDNKQPTLFLSQIHYIGHVKRRESVGVVISTPDAIKIYTYNADQKCVEQPKVFSEHEKKIIALLAQGFDSKTIAKMLFLSPHTVDTHRRRLIKKMDCIDTTGVVAFAKLINLI